MADSKQSQVNDELVAQIAATYEARTTELAELEATYEAMLTSNDSIQEDLDSTKQMVETVRRQAQGYADAQQRIADGTFGVCAGCNDTIPTARLEAIPTAERCAACA